MHGRKRFLGSRMRSFVVLVLGTIVVGSLLAFALTALVEEFRERRQPPVDTEGSVSVVMCPDCKEAFHDLLLGGGDIACALYDVGSETGAVLAQVGARVLTDDETGASYGEPVPGSALMHHKFCVINGTVVTSGSYNPTDGGERGRNNLVIITSPTLAKNYRVAFDALARNRRVGAERPVVFLGADEERVRVENNFCPSDDCEGLLVATIDSANESVAFMTFSFTSDAVGDALLRARSRGVLVEGVCDGGQSRSEREYNECSRVGAVLWERGGGRSLLHHKVFIVDERTVVTGSYNPTASGARRNDENVLVVTDEAFADAFIAEYDAVQAVLAETP